MSQIQISEVSDFTGGLNFRADQFQLASYESPDMLNVEIDPRGGVFSRGQGHGSGVVGSVSLYLYPITGIPYGSCGVSRCVPICKAVCIE